MPAPRFRPLIPEDIDALYQAARESQGPGFSEWMPWCHADYSRSDSELYILSRPAASQAGEDYTLGMFDPESGQLLGLTGINQINRLHQLGNLGYWVRRSRWGQGLAGYTNSHGSCPHGPK